MKYETVIKQGIFLLVILPGFSSSLLAASVELWPSDRRRNNTQYCYGNDWNMLRFGLYSDIGKGSNSNGKYKIELPKTLTEETILEVTLPREVEFLGVYCRGDNRVSKEYKTQRLSEGGKEYTRITIPLDNERLSTFMAAWDCFHEIHVWYKPPEHLDDMLRWKLTYGGNELASSAVRLRTAGVVQKGRKFPKHFGFYPYSYFRLVPEDNYDIVAEFYKRFGVAGIVERWDLTLPESDGRYRNMFEVNRRNGVKNIANIDSFCEKYGQSRACAYSGAIKNTSGLVEAMDIACAGIESNEAKKAWEIASPYFDMVLYDWEPAGPNTWPGYDEPATIACFAKVRGIAEPLTPELVETKYRKEYARFRMEQTARPLYSLKKTIDAVKPLPMFIEQGAGLNANIDYDVYGNDFEYVRPMIYMTTPLAYARDMVEMLKSTSVPAKKFAPNTTIGWPASVPHRESPEEFLLDTIVTAAAGCGSVAHWPELYRTDAALFGIHEGLARVALVEDFYFDGKPVDTISITGIPYREQKIDLGDKTIELYAPDWRPVLLGFAHQLQDEYLLTILNYHKEEDAFIKVNSPVLKGFYLVDPVHKMYCVCDDAGRAVVRVNKETPVLWIATKNKARIAGYKQIRKSEIDAQFKTARDKYLETNKTGNVHPGKVGDINVAYDQAEFGGYPKICLRVTTPMQSFCFGDNGGRINDWSVKGMPDFISRQEYASDGFGMDLLWLPVPSRWSGDETQTMNLVKCENNGAEARIVYEGKFKQGLAGVSIQKEYVVSASGSSLTGTITMRNHRALPVEFSYWQHNVLCDPSADFITGTEPVQKITGCSVFPAKNLPEEFKKHVVTPNDIAGSTGRIYAEYFPKSRSGLVFRLPENFMAVYRWCSPVRSKRSSEWMTCPINLPAGGTETLRYSITAVPNTTPEALQKLMK